MLALDTASGPVARRMARATSWSGTRTPMLPLVSPRSIRRLACAVRMRVNGPGQYLLARSRAAAGTSFVYASSTSASPMRTGGGMSRPRFLASSSPWTACGENGSAAIPYTVSVGKTTLSPARIAVRTVSIAVGRSSALTTIGSRSGSGSGSISGTASGSISGTGSGSISGTGSGSISGTGSGSISGTGSGSISGTGSPLVRADPGSCVEPSGAVAGLPSRGVVSSLDSVTRSSCQPTRAGTNDRADSQDASRGDEAPAARQITVIADGVVAAVPCVQREHVRLLSLRVLGGQQPSGTEQTSSNVGHDAQRIQPVGAGEHGERRVVVAHIRRDALPRVEWDVRRVDDDQIDGRVQLGQAVGHVPLHDARAGSCEVGREVCDGVGRHLERPLVE